MTMIVWWLDLQLPMHQCLSPLSLWVWIPLRQGVLDITLCDQVCQWLVAGRWFSLYNIMWSSLSVTCGKSVVFSIQHYVIKFVSDLWQVGGFLYITLCDQVCQWLVAGRWFSLYNIMWSSLSVTCGRSVVFSRYSWFLFPIKLTATI